MNMNKTISKWIPLFATLVISAVTLVIYSIINDERSARMYLQVIAAAFVPGIFPLIGRLTKREFPNFLNVLISLHIILANDLGSTLGFYKHFEVWDLIMHGYFGFVFSVIIYILLLRWNGAVLNKLGVCAIVFLSTLGAAALWEIWEFSCDTLLGGDAQLVKAALENGSSSIADTMTDIIVAIVGIAVFYMALYIDKRHDYKISGAIRIQARKEKYR